MSVKMNSELGKGFISTSPKFIFEVLPLYTFFGTDSNEKRSYAKKIQQRLQFITLIR